MSKGHAQVIEHAVAVSGKTLQSKHILVSPQFRPLVQEVLEASPEGPGREAFLMRRAGVIDGEDRVELGSPIGYEWHLSQIAGNIAPDKSAGAAHGVASGWQSYKVWSTIFHPRCNSF